MTSKKLDQLDLKGEATVDDAPAKTAMDAPQTPDFPPPSPLTAMMGISEKILPKDFDEIEWRKKNSSSLQSTKTTTSPKQKTSPPCSSDDSEVISAQHHTFAGLFKGVSRKRRTFSAIEQPSRLSMNAAADDDGRLSAEGARETVTRLVVDGKFNPASVDGVDQSTSAGGTAEMDYDWEGVIRRAKSVSDECGNGAATEEQRARRRRTKSVFDSFDENEEWEAISQILATFGEELSSNSSSKARRETIRQSWRDSVHLVTVGSWLETLLLGQYENLLLANGFDELEFLRPNILEEDDLIEMGVVCAPHRETMLKAIAADFEPLPTTKLNQSVEAWLESLHLATYVDNFTDNGFINMDRVARLWELELSTVLDIPILGHRKRIIASLGNRQIAPPPAFQTPESPASPDVTLDHIDWDFLNTIDAGPREQDLLNNNFGREAADELIELLESTEQFIKDRQSVLVVQQRTQAAAADRTSSNGVIVIRPPTDAYHQSGLCDWPTDPQVLIDGCVTYTAKYLGSSWIRNLAKATCIKESIEKLKKSTISIMKIPTIQLSVSFRGVQFIDAQSKRVVCEHDICNIQRAYQDPDDLRCFAYITKDHVTRKHYCHVFRADTTELSTAIMLSLGEAFEIAFQVINRAKTQQDEQRQSQAVETPSAAGTTGGGGGASAAAGGGGSDSGQEADYSEG